MNIGDRVGAIATTDQKENTALFFGYGVYQGREIPPHVEGDFMSAMLSGAQIPNPKILLDSGEVVWGYQCWWGPEEMTKQALDGVEITMITVAEYNLLAETHGKE